MSHTRRRLVLGAIALAAAGVVLALSWRRTRGAQPGGARRDNVLLITLDTARADHIGAWGYAKARTPRLDRLAAEGVRFESASAVAPLTLPSHASILTGLYPPEHGVRNNGNFYLEPKFDTVATVLKKEGYRTAAFVSAFILDRRYGLARGFETYDDGVAEGAQPEVFSLDAQRTGDKTVAAFVRWLEAHAASPERTPFFLWLHLYDPHEPYQPPSPHREAFPSAPYDGEIAFTDALVGSALDALERLHLKDRTLVAVVGDHGESLGDHGEETHSMFVYESAIQVPLILWRPGALPSGRVVRDPVRGIDLAPTILEMVGGPALPAPQARSLLPLIQGTGDRSPRSVYSETLLPQLDMGWAPLRALRDQRYKLIDAPRPELYDLQRDPSEEASIYGQKPQVVEALRRELDRITGGQWGAMTVTAMDREAREKLAALGYVGAKDEAVPTPGVGEPGTDPKDAIVVFNKLRHASVAVQQQRPKDALAIIADVAKTDPGNALARFIEGSARMQMGEYPAAVARFRRYVKLKPAKAVGHHMIALCLLKLGDREGALREADATLALEPHFVDAHLLRGRVLQGAGNAETAIADYRAAVKDDPEKPVVRLALARALLEAGHPAEARGEYEALLRQRPDYAPGLAGLGTLLVRAGDIEAASPLLSRAVQLDSEQEAARFALAQILEGQGRSTEAQAEYARVVETLRRTLQADPERAEARLNLARVLERSGRPAEAAVEYRRLAKGPRTPSRIRALAGDRLAALGPS